MSKLFCLMGKSASGKDTVYRKLITDADLSLKKVIPYTTRPMRSGEKDGQDYFFVTGEKYEEMRSSGRVIESRTYQTVQGPWTYFTADDGQITAGKKEDDENCIIVGTLDVYRALRKYFGSEIVIPLYIEVEDGLRLERAIAREKSQNRADYAEMCRRYLADEEDFSEENLREAGIVKTYDNTDLVTCLACIKNDMAMGNFI